MTQPKPDRPPLGGSGVTFHAEPNALTPADAGMVCALLHDGRLDPELWTWEERRAVSRLHLLGQSPSVTDDAGTYGAVTGGNGRSPRPTGGEPDA